MRLTSTACAVAIGLLAFSAPVAAQTRYWGPDDTLGGSGIWTSASLNWGDSDAGPFNLNSHGNSANNFFAGSAGTVTLDGTVAFRSLNFLTDGYQLTGGGNPVLARNSDMIIAARDAGITTTVTGITFDTPNDRHVFVGFGTDHENLGTVVFDGNHFDGQGMEVRSGTAVLEGTNTFKDLSNSRVVIREGGTLLIASETAMGADPGLLPDVPLLPGGQILFDEAVLSGAFTFGSLSNSGGLALENTAGAPIELTVGTNNRSTSHSGTLSGDGSLVKAGTGTFTLSGNNTYTGLTIIDEGTLRLGHNSALGSTDAGTMVNPGGTLDLNGRDVRGEAITVAGTITNTGGSQHNALRDVTLSGDATFTGTGRWDIRGAAGQLDLAGYTLTKTGGNMISVVDMSILGAGAVVIEDGTFQLARANWDEGSVTVNGAGTLRFYGASTYGMDMTIHGGRVENVDNSSTVTGAVHLTGAPTFDVASGVSFTAIGPVSGPGSLTKAGGGTLVLSAANTYEGGTTISGGTLRVKGDGTLGTGDVTNEGSLAFNPSGELTVNNVISGSGTLTKTGSGTVILTGDNSYAGATTVSAGVLQIAHANALGSTSGATTIAGGSASSRLELAGGVEFAPEPLTLEGRGSSGSASQLVNHSGNNTWTGPIRFTTGGHHYSIESSSGLLTIAGDIVNDTGTGLFRALYLRGDGDGQISGRLRNLEGSTGPFEVTKTGSGTWTLTGDNLHTGTTSVNAGALRVAHPNALGDTSGGTTIPGGGASSRLELAGGVEFAPEPLTLGGRSNATSPAHLLNYEGDNTWTGEISFTTGGHYYAIESASGTLTVTGDVVNNTGNDAYRTLDLRGEGHGHISGQLRNGTGTGLYHVNKLGSGTSTFSGDNLHTGTTTVGAGTLLVSNTTGSGTGSGPVVVEEDAILGGTGIIGGATTIEAGGILSPGVTIGRLTFEDSLTLAPGSAIRWEFDGKESAGEDYDSILGFGDDAALYLPNPQADPIHLSIFGPGTTLTPGDSFTLFDGAVFDHTAEPLPFGADLTGLFAIDDHSGWWGTWEVSAGSLILTAVPEPGTWLLLFSALACGLLVRRRR